MTKPRKKILKICLIVIILILLCFAVPLIYKLNIVLKQAKAYDEFGKGDNYKFICESVSDENGFQTTSKSTTFQKDEKIKLILESNDSDGLSTYNCEYWIGKEVFFVDEINKEFSISENNFSKAFLEARSGRSLFIYNFTQTETWLEALSYIPLIIPNKIVFEEYEGKDCYKCIYNKKYDEVTDEFIIYIDKESSLPVFEAHTYYDAGEEISKRVQKFSYEKDMITDADVNMPDLSEYKQEISYFYKEEDSL